MDWMSVLKVVIAFTVLAVAARADWKTREASDRFWIIIGVAGMAFLAVQVVLDSADLAYLLMLLPIAIFFMDIFWDRKGMFEDGISPLPLAMYALSFGILAVMTYLYHEELYFWR
jgi:hypothetical protein